MKKGKRKKNFLSLIKRWTRCLPGKWNYYNFLQDDIR